MHKLITMGSLGCFIALLCAGAPAMAQSDNTTEFKPSGKIWGYAFGDYAYKGSGDTVNGGGRGGSNQYTKVPANMNLFQFRRVYLGYNYDISKSFSGEFLLAAEDDVTSGDLLANGKFAPYVKLANVRWKNIFKRSDLVFGQMNTPGFAKTAKNSQSAEEVWGYRAIERTITDVRRTPSYDFGAALQGTFDSAGNFGYIAMVGNGQSAKPENDMFKAFYGDVFAKFLDRKLVVDLYQDYQKLNWTNVVDQKAGHFHHDRAMTKLFAAYTTPKLTVGAEYFMNTLMGDLQVTGKDGNTYYRTTKAMGFSVFVKGAIYKDKLGFFARYDSYDPSGNLKNVTNDIALDPQKYVALTSQYDPTTKESFATFGIDFTPVKNVHIMPNVWINNYESALTATGTTAAGTANTKLNGNVSGEKGTDAVYRITLYYRYGN